MSLVEININYDDTEYFDSEYGWGVYPSSVQCWDKERLVKLKIKMFHHMNIFILLFFILMVFLEINIIF